MKPVEILLVEDNPGDAELTFEALEEGKISNDVHWVKHGEEAIDYLNDKKETRDFPDIVLLDLNLPRISGHEVLEYIKEDDILKKIPTVILTTSEDQDDVIESYDLQANAYLTKPIKLEKFLEMMKTFENFWLSVVKLPLED